MTWLLHRIFCPCRWTENAIEQVETHTAFGFSRLMKLPRRKGPVVWP